MRPLILLLVSLTSIATTVLGGEDPPAEPSDGIPIGWYCDRTIQEAIEKTRSITGHEITAEDGVRLDRTFQLFPSKTLEDASLVIPKEGVEDALRLLLLQFNYILDGVGIRGCTDHRIHGKGDGEGVSTFVFSHMAPTMEFFNSLQHLLKDPRNIGAIRGVDGLVLSGSVEEMREIHYFAAMLDRASCPFDVEVEVYSASLSALREADSPDPFDCEAEDLAEALSGWDPKRAGVRLVSAWKGPLPNASAVKFGRPVSIDVRTWDLHGSVTIGYRIECQGVNVLKGGVPGRESTELRPVETTSWSAKITCSDGVNSGADQKPQEGEALADPGSWMHRSFRRQNSVTSDEVLVWLVRVIERP